MRCELLKFTFVCQNLFGNLKPNSSEYVSTIPSVFIVISEFAWINSNLEEHSTGSYKKPNTEVTEYMCSILKDLS